MIWIAPYRYSDNTAGFILADDTNNTYFYSTWEPTNRGISSMVGYQREPGTCVIERFASHIRYHQWADFPGFIPCPSASSIIDFQAVRNNHPEFLL